MLEKTRQRHEAIHRFYDNYWLNDHQQDPCPSYALSILRISDSQSKSQLQFEFEMSGCGFILNSIIKRMSKLLI